jgi:hypothetical protein
LGLLVDGFDAFGIHIQYWMPLAVLICHGSYRYQYADRPKIKLGRQLRAASIHVTSEFLDNLA